MPNKANKVVPGTARGRQLAYRVPVGNRPAPFNAGAQVMNKSVRAALVARARRELRGPGIDPKAVLRAFLRGRDWTPFEPDTKGLPTMLVDAVRALVAAGEVEEQVRADGSRVVRLVRGAPPEGPKA